MVPGGGRLGLCLTLAAFMGVGNVGSYTILRALVGDDVGQADDSAATTSNAYAYVGFVNALASTIGFAVGPTLALQVRS